MPDTAVATAGQANAAKDGKPALAPVKLDDKYTSTSGKIFISGIQALVRLPLMQRQRDLAAGLNTAGFVSGYRGSPLGGLDENLWKAQKLLEENHIKFVPGVNEDLAATAVWGTQTVDLIGPAKYDGVFAMWYGKGPGVDRCGDVFKHMNHAGTAKHGGVLLVAGDDHGAYSSTLPHQSDHIFAACMIPVLYPCNVQEYLDLGLHAWAMSRYSGCAVGFKALADTVESTASVDADPFRLKIEYPTDFIMPEGGLNTRLSTDTLGIQARKQEALMQDYKIYAALAYARANKLNHTTIDSPKARLGIIASGKSYLDVLEAMEELGIDEKMAADIGIRVFKVAMPWPLEPDGVREFAQGLDEILVVEEKRQIVEYQLKEQLYNWRDDVRPRVIGKFDEKGEWVHPRGEWLLPPKADFSIAQIARVISQRIARFHTSDLIKARLAFLEAKDKVLSKAVNTPPRPAYYCSGCPHNTSTKVPEGSFALAGIGCHVMATAIYPEFNKLTTHMGGEGAPWIGQAAFSKVPHVFQNLGDGTYFHSGYLAIRAAVAANVNITYKILYNDAVAMTGGQPVDGITSVPMIAQQMVAEGVKRIALVTEDLGRYEDRSSLPSIVTLHDRKDMDAVQRELREVPGVTVLIYDQTCAAEKRRRRKKNEYPDPNKRLFINDAVCEGCGDCGVQSNCTSIMPLETEFGRKRAIDQSSCNKDYSCVKGFCPSFVTVEGGTLKKSRT
ncbi:MAG TPA: indolepyruvate ferredoxin oxidoreductase family protein, partial [Noviherbaspirillum sp.]|uniref:indolepyruvate ferredoxin oxidoreductase family protein n=1 Tax=Noviherbaspirillum sp. TaxID=1926288 RepID=UPI002D571449